MKGGSKDSSIQEVKKRLHTAIRSLALQGARLEAYTRTVRMVRASMKANGSQSNRDCGCGAEGPSVARTALIQGHVPVKERLCKALMLFQANRLADRAFRKVYTNARTIWAVSEHLELMQDPMAWRGAIKMFVESPKSMADARKLLTHYGFNIDVAQYVIDELARLEAPPLLANDLKVIKFYQKARRDKVAGTVSALTGDELDEAVDEAPIDIEFVDGKPVVSVRCERLPFPADIGCSIVVIAIFIVIGVIIIVNWLEDLFNDTDDDNARGTINSSTCSQLAALSIDTRLQMIRAMIDGPTGDDDENAIARLLECSPCQDVQRLVSLIGLGNLLDEFQGSEWDRLMLRLQQCGLVSFADFDDDATREFINRSDCATLNALQLTDIRQLILNMFSGHTGDEDEGAILKLIGCLPCIRRQMLMSMSGMSYDDFDDEVDGSEWDALKGLLRCE